MSENLELSQAVQQEAGFETREKQIEKLYAIFGLTKEDEQKQLKIIKAREEGYTIEQGYRRSFENMRYSLGEFVQLFEANGQSLEQITQLLKQEAEKIKENITLGFCCDMERCFQILEQGQISNAFNIKKEAMGPGLDKKIVNGYLERRAETERELGWDYGTVASLAIDDQTDEMKNGTSKQWGYIRFVCDFAKLKDKATFTLGDSMSSSLGSGIVKYGNIEDRQICDQHILLAKTMFNILRQPESPRNTKTNTCGYIEAQVSLDRLQTKDSAKEIAIDLKSLFEQYIYVQNGKRFSDYLFEQEYGVKPDDIICLKKDWRNPIYILKKDADNPAAPHLNRNTNFFEQTTERLKDLYVTLWQKYAQEEIDKIMANLKKYSIPFRFISSEEENLKEALSITIDRFIKYKYFYGHFYKEFS